MNPKMRRAIAKNQRADDKYHSLRKRLDTANAQSKAASKEVAEHCDHIEEDGSSAVGGEPYQQCGICHEWW